MQHLVEGLVEARRFCRDHESLRRGLRHNGRAGIVQRREQIAAPESQEDEREAANRPEGEPTASLREFPTHDHQAQVEQPYHP